MTDRIKIFFLIVLLILSISGCSEKKLKPIQNKKWLNATEAATNLVNGPVNNGIWGQREKIKDLEKAAANNESWYKEAQYWVESGLEEAGVNIENYDWAVARSKRQEYKEMRKGLINPDKDSLEMSIIKIRETNKTKYLLKVRDKPSDKWSTLNTYEKALFPIDFMVYSGGIYRFKVIKDYKP